MRIERRLRQPRWLLVAVPAGSLVFAFFASGLVLLATGHDPLSSYRKIIDAAFVSNGALGQTLISATPLAFTGLAAAAAFRMRLFNIGAEGQLYLGAITAAATGLYLGGSGGASPFVIAAMIVAGCAGGAGDRADVELTLAADVEEAHPEGRRCREARERERRRRDQRVAERAVVQERRVEEPAVTRERVVAGREQDEARGEEREDERAGWHGDHEPARLAQAALNPHVGRALPP